MNQRCSLLPALLRRVMDFRVDLRYWDQDDLSWEQQTSERAKPLPYLLTTIDLLAIAGGHRVVEIGAMRNAMSPSCPLAAGGDAFRAPPCCNDGHSTFFFARAGFDVHSVDVDVDCRLQIERSYANLGLSFPSNLHLHIPEDGLELLSRFDQEIDLLFLDGWDKGTPRYAELHLEAYLRSCDKLAPTHFVAVDDTDFRTLEGGKDRLLAPVLIDGGYYPLLRGRQSLFVKLGEPMAG